MAYWPRLDQAGPSARCRPVWTRRITSWPIRRPLKDASTLMMSGSGEKAGAALGEKSRGGSVITERGVPRAALTSAACARAGTLTAAPASIRRRLSSVMGSLSFLLGVFLLGADFLLVGENVRKFDFR